MAQIHALTPEGRLPSQAVAHVQEIALPYRSGRRSVTGLIAGAFTLERVGTTVVLSCSNGRPPATGTVAAINLPAGFRPAVRATGVAAEGSSARPLIAQSYNPYVVEIRGVATANSYVDFTIRFETADPAPTTLPGTPA